MNPALVMDTTTRNANTSALKRSSAHLLTARLTAGMDAPEVLAAAVAFLP
jgi:hypothetical protein